MTYSTTPRPRMTTLTRRRIATTGTHPYHQYGLRPLLPPGSVIAAPANGELVE